MAMSMDPSVWPSSDMSAYLTDDNAQNVNLTDVAGNDDFMAQVVCYLNAGGNDYDGSLGAHISSIFVVLVISTAVTFFPVLATRQTKVKIPLYVYLFARYFGAGVIIATAFIQ
jgi:zinc transporter 1/2/3